MVYSTKNWGWFVKDVGRLKDQWDTVSSRRVWSPSIHPSLKFIECLLFDIACLRYLKKYKTNKWHLPLWGLCFIVCVGVGAGTDTLESYECQEEGKKVKGNGEFGMYHLFQRLHLEKWPLGKGVKEVKFSMCYQGMEGTDSSLSCIISFGPHSNP